MFIESIQINYFKGFLTEDNVVHFSFPVGNKYGSGLTYFVGANNSGKTTAIEAITKASQPLGPYRQAPAFYLSEIGVMKPKITLSSTSGEACNITKSDVSDAAIVDNPLFFNKIKIINLSASRYWMDKASQPTDQKINYLYNNFLNSNQSHRIPGQADYYFAGLLKEIFESGLRDYFINCVKEIYPNFHSLTFERDDADAHVSVIYNSETGIRHSVRNLGQGFLNILKIIYHLIHLPQGFSTIIIDEPELALHPQAQKRLSNFIARFAEAHQIILSTHSPYMVNNYALKNGGL